ncbi:MAG: hypothetical protein K0R49_547 [Burkholderiales bacterium]|jgi:hypothetical protein|nr:hypothetical protein [Burkholderiales bacterium]
MKEEKISYNVDKSYKQQFETTLDILKEQQKIINEFNNESEIYSFEATISIPQSNNDNSPAKQHIIKVKNTDEF